MIVVTIRREELIAARACHNGLALFDSLKAEQDDERRYARRKAVAA